MTQAQIWAARRLRAQLIRLKIAVGLLVAGGLVFLLLDLPLVGVLIVLGGLSIMGLISTTSQQLRAVERAIRNQQGSASP